MSLQENRVKFNEDAKIYQGKRLTDFFQEAGYNAITYSFSPSIIPLEDNGEYDANAIVIFNDKDVKIDECEKAEDGKNIYYKPKLIKKSVLNDFQSGSSLDFYDNKIFVVGDDTKDLLIINTDFEELNRVRLFESPDRRIAKDLKADLETSTIINHNGTPSILMLGSGARDNKSFGYIVPFETLKVTEPFKYDVFINRLKDEHGIEKVNIEGSASMDDDFILSNRGNKNNPDNFLIITENNFWENQSTVKISLSRLLLPNKDAGVSEIYYETDSDTLFFTASVEQTTNNYDDGEIGDSFIGYISNFSNKLSENTVTPDLFINLTEIDSSFNKQKIEGICIENKSDEYYTINLVSDNDNDESTIFKIELKKQNIAANGKKIPERYKNIGFTRVGQKKKSTRPEKKWMVLARKGDKYKVVHGGYRGMQDYSQHHDDVRRKRFWNRMGGFDSEKANDPFSPLYWHKKFGTWEDGGPIYDNGGLIAPNGKKSNLTPKQYKLVRTPEFISWFGNWIDSPEIASKVVDENGEPLVVWHGGSFTGGEFKGNAWFTFDKSGAKYYAKQNNGIVTQAFLSIKNPYYSGHINKKDYVETNNAVLVAQKNKKQDGVIDLDINKKIIDCIVWTSNQIKLADGSNTTFDGNNKDIRYDNGGLVGSQEFKAWFGDWENHPETASKVVDENGYPKVVYHGTTSDFNEFNRTSGEFGSGIYFGSSDDATYFSNVSAGHNKFGNQSVIPVYLNNRNPFYYSVYSAKRAIPTRSKLISLGYDGVFGRTLNDTLEIVAFYPNQIKSSIGNKKFNSDDNSILAENGIDIPVMDEETYLSINGAPSGFGDPALHKNRGGASDKAWTKIIDRQAAKDRDLMDKRERLRQEYNEKVAKGEIRPPSRYEKLISIAQGHPDLESTQAARRILDKKGVSWE